MKGTLYGVGVGPGDPELLTLKALKALQAAEVVVHGFADPEQYPLQKKRISYERLREIAHLRPRTNTIGAVARWNLEGAATTPMARRRPASWRGEVHRSADCCR